MSARAATWLAWSLWGLVVALDAALAAPYQLDWYALTHPFYRGAEGFADVLRSLPLVFAIPAYATVGALIASLRPKNAIGWLCFVPAFLLVAVGWSPGLGNVADLMQSLAWNLMVPPLPVTLMLLIFPDGRLLSRRWWVVVVLALIGYALTVLAVYSPGAYAAVGLQEPVGQWVSLAALLASSVAAILRWRRSRDRERQQLKWLAYMVALTVVAVLGLVISGSIWGGEHFMTFFAYEVVAVAVGLGIPVAIGLAVLKHRLYDIDVVVNRTLVYGTLTAVLVAVYFGGIVASQRLLVFLSGEESTLAIVASTLLIAALFNPLRCRVQAFVDRRFYRRKYDAAKTLADFNARLRNETDLDTLSGDLVGVVRETMQPAHASLWLRPELSQTGKQAN